MGVYARCYITMQQPQLFFSFDSRGSCTRVVLAGFEEASGRVTEFRCEGSCGLCMVGVSLYAPCSPPFVPGLPVAVSGFGLGRGHWSGSCSFLSDGSNSFVSISGLLNSSVFSSLKSRSYIEPVLPSFSHCSCCMRLACVGIIC